jgi:acetyl-CoA acetyltransferase
MQRAGMTIDDVDLVEINEAFAAQVVPSAKHLGIPWDQCQADARSRTRPSPRLHPRIQARVGGSASATPPRDPPQAARRWAGAVLA